MVIIDYKDENHKQIISSCAAALKQGRVVAYPTDTSYGLAADATNLKAIKKLYRIKERPVGQPMHIIIPSRLFAARVARWGKAASRLAKKFWPGPLTLVLGIKQAVPGEGEIQALSANTGFVGLRCPNNRIALDLAKSLKRPITATSANPSARLSGGVDSYSAVDITRQFRGKKYRPDIVIDAGRLPRQKPSTMVKISGRRIEILRPGPISEKQIKKALNK